MILKNTKGRIEILSETADDKITQKGDCNIYEKGEEIIVFYSEEEQTLSGDVKSTLKIKKNQIDLIRKGTYSSNMIFYEGYEHSFCYNTPYGGIDMKIKTKSIKFFSPYQFELVYDITNGGETSENRMKITIERNLS